MYAVTLGLEEEFFVLYQGKTHLVGLSHLARLLRYSGHFYTHSASNFTRGKGVQQGLMSALEVSTRVHDSPQTLLQEVQDLRHLISGLIPSGLLCLTGMTQNDDLYNTAGLHVHVGVPAAEVQRVYANIAYFLPVLALASASTPFKGTHYFGQSYRMACSYALGALTPDPKKRFQDLIITRRLGTIELRILDPVWDMARLHAIVDAVTNIAKLPRTFALDVSQYAVLRQEAVTQGYSPSIRSRAEELQQLTGFDVQWCKHTVSDDLMQIAREYGYNTALRHLDSGYRTGHWQTSATPENTPPPLASLEGWLCYYLPKLPYIIYKAWKEN